MEFYTKVNNLCREKGISITALALELGFSKGTPTNWEKMTKPPRAENVKKIAEHLGVPVSYFDENTNQTIHDNHGVIGTNNGHIYNGISNETLGEIERELLAICSNLDTKRKNAEKLPS